MVSIEVGKPEENDFKYYVGALHCYCMVTNKAVRAHLATVVEACQCDLEIQA